MNDGRVDEAMTRTFFTLVVLIAVAIAVRLAFVAPTVVLGIASGVGLCVGIFAFWYWCAGP